MMSAYAVGLLLLAGAGSVEPPRDARVPRPPRPETVECPGGAYTSLAALELIHPPLLDLAQFAARRPGRPKLDRPPCATLA